MRCTIINSRLVLDSLGYVDSGRLNSQHQHISKVDWVLIGVSLLKALETVIGFRLPFKSLVVGGRDL